MSNITFNVELSHYKKKGGLRNVSVRITENKNHKRIKIGFAVKWDEWSGKPGHWISTRHPECGYYNNVIQTRLSQLQKAYLSLKEDPLNNYITKHTVYKEVTKGEQRVDFLKYWDLKFYQIENYSHSKTYLTTVL